MAKKSASKLIQSLNIAGRKDWLGLIEELESGSDRATAVLGGVFLDEQLRELLENFLVEDKSILDEMFGIDKPLSTFSSRIKTVFALGLVSTEVYHDLNVIRNVRNTFAHALHGISFENGDISSWCQNLIIPRIAIPYLKVDVPARNLFTVATLFIGSYVTMKKEEIKVSRREIPNDVSRIAFTTVDKGSEENKEEEQG